MNYILKVLGHAGLLGTLACAVKLDGLDTARMDVIWFTVLLLAATNALFIIAPQNRH